METEIDPQHANTYVIMQTSDDVIKRNDMLSYCYKSTYF